MKNYKSFETCSGNLEVFETDEPVARKPEEPLLWHHVYNIEVLEQEFALIKQTDLRNPTRDTQERVEQVSCCAIEETVSDSPSCSKGSQEKNLG